MTAQQKSTQSGIFPGFFSDDLAGSDAELASAISQEFDRQQHEIELIASENIVSRAVLKRKVQC